MAVKLIFQSSEKSNWDSTLQCYLNCNNEIYISIEDEDHEQSFIVLDRQDSIKLVKVLKTEINKMMEVNNG